jgi:4-amino-4-deoxy-L-arabinose transferase-like glycosyltransferase
VIERLFRNPYSPLLLIAAYFFLQWLLRVFIGGSFELDEAEQMVLGQRLQLGYSPDPPLYTWLQIPLAKLLGEGVAALSLLKNLLLFALYVCTYFIARHCGLARQHAGLAALSLLLLPQVGWESQRDLTHSVLVTTLAAATLWAVLALLDGRQHWRQYILLGVLLGLGVLSKWNYAFFALALLVTLASMRPALLLRPAAILTPLVAVALAAPFLFWMQEHLALATGTSYKLKTGEIAYWHTIGSGLLSLAYAYLLFVALFVPVFVLVFQPWKHQQQAGAARQHPPGLRFLIRLFWVTLGIMLLFLLVSGTTFFRERWLLPVLFYLPVMIFALAPAGIWEAARIRRYQKVLLAMMLFVLLGLAARVYLLPLAGKYTKPHFPGEALAGELLNAAGSHEVLIASRSFVAGNLMPWLGDTFVSSPSLDFPLDAIRREGEPVLLVWETRKSSALPAALLAYAQQRLGGNLTLIGTPGMIEAPYRFWGDTRVGLAWQLVTVDSPPRSGRPGMSRSVDNTPQR